jgi:hypothetical protein
VAGFIASQRDAHGVPQAVSCRALGVSQSWFYKWKDGVLPPRAARRERLKAETPVVSYAGLHLALVEGCGADTARDAAAEADPAGNESAFPHGVIVAFGQ